MRQRLSFGRRFSMATVSIFTLAACCANQSAVAGDAKIFDELRFGASGSIEDGHDHEKGVFPEVQVLFNPFGYDPAGDWKEQLSKHDHQFGLSKVLECSRHQRHRNAGKCGYSRRWIVVKSTSSPVIVDNVLPDPLLNAPH